MKILSVNPQALKAMAMVIMGWLLVGTSNAEPVWHCSRTSVQMADASDNFTLAGLIDREVIQISLRDLHEVYSGQNVRLSGSPLSACVMRDNASTQAALGSLGIPTQAVAAMARQYVIGKRNVFMVNDADGMEQCIAEHHPAIGYLPQATETEALGPCF